MESNVESRPATKAEIAAFERGEQKPWRCPECGHEVELLGAVMAFCGDCRVERHKLIQMERS